MAPSLTKQEVKEILLRVSNNGLTHGQNFYNCVTQGDADFTEQYGNDPTLKSRAKAEVRNSKILHYVRQLMLEDPASYEFVEDTNSFYVRVATSLNVRFKKLDDRGRSSNGKTKRDFSYRQQESIRLPFAIPASVSVNMDVGYILNEMGFVSAVKFSCCAPLNLGVHWTLPAKDLNIVESQQSLFAISEQEIFPVEQLDLKEHLKKNSNDRQAGGAI